MRGNRWIVIGLLLLVLLVGGGGVYFVVNSEAPPSSGSKKPRKERPPRTPGSRGKNRDAAEDAARTDTSGGSTTAGTNAGGGTSTTGAPRGRDAPLIPVPPVKPKVSGDSGVATDTASDVDDGTPSAPLEVKGIVLDGGEGTPIVGARVLYAMIDADGNEAGGWEGDTTDAEGRFKPTAWKKGATKGKTGELRVRAAGYMDWIGPVHEADITVRLEKHDGAPAPGSLRGTVLTKGGDPYEGRVQFEGSDAFGNNMGQWTETDSSGGFTLSGMPSGTWRIRVGAGARVTVVISEGGESWASFTAGDSDIAEGKARADTDRRVVVTVPSDAEGAVSVRAEVKPRSFWRAPVSGGTAEFAQLPIGSYTFVIETPGKADRTQAATVEAGDDALSVTFEK